MNPGAAEQAQHVVDGFHATLLEVMKNAKALGVKGRYEKFAPVIARLFDSQLMVAIATGQYWRRANPEQRNELVSAFRRMSAATYAARFNGYSGQNFNVVSVEPGPRATMIVHTRIVEPGAKPVPLSYVLRKSAAVWRIVDVLVDQGISELAVRRSEYSTILHEGGVSGLVKSLDSKTARLLDQ